MTEPPTAISPEIAGLIIALNDLRMMEGSCDYHQEHEARYGARVLVRDDCLYRAAVPTRNSNFDSGQGGELGEIPLQAPPLSADRTRSPAAVSRKREYFGEPPETFDEFALQSAKSAAGD